MHSKEVIKKWIWQHDEYPNFRRESVHSSFRKKLDKDFDARSDKYATATTDSLV